MPDWHLEAKFSIEEWKPIWVLVRSLPGWGQTRRGRANSQSFHQEACCHWFNFLLSCLRGTIKHLKFTNWWPFSAHFPQGCKLHRDREEFCFLPCHASNLVHRLAPDRYALEVMVTVITEGISICHIQISVKDSDNFPESLHSTILASVCICLDLIAAFQFLLTFVSWFLIPMRTWFSFPILYVTSSSLITLMSSHKKRYCVSLIFLDAGLLSD